MARDYILERPDRSGGGPSIDFQAELNEQQYAAVTSPPGPALVIAGAGSGKTRTLTYRVAYLLENGIAPENILLLTFTNKAAKEMLERVEELIPSDTSKLWGGTFHSVANRILRRHAEKVEFSRSFSIMDREDQKDVMNSVIAESDINPKEVRFPKPEVLLDLFSLGTNMELRVQDLLTSRYPYFEELTSPILDMRQAYRNKKQEVNSMDFDDLLHHTLSLFDAHPEVQDSYRHQFQFVLVDEYQDTNSLQARLISAFAGGHKNLMVVGDDAQSIYSWRGANFRNILKFPEEYEGAKIFKIETNYRSVPEILRLANRSIALNKEQFEKELQSVRPDKGSAPAIITLGSPTEQAQFVAQRILELREEGMELEEIAVLYRAHYHAMELQLELTNRNIPFQITSGMRFFEQAHIKDVAAFLKLTINRRDEIAFKRIVRLLPGIGNKTADSLWRAWNQTPEIQSDESALVFSDHLLGFKVPAKAKESWSQLAYTLDELVPDGALAPPSEMIRSVLGGIYEDYLYSKFTNSESRKQDLDQLLQYSQTFDEVESFLSQLSLLSGVETGGVSEEPDAEQICLSSVHQAKGLEWRVVFVIWLADGMFPNAKAVDGEGEGLEEERRLFYVAVTRAKDELYLTLPRFWYSGQMGKVIQKPSRFLEEIPKDLMEEWRVGYQPF
ncbi:MAG: ATP-dependent helicase [Verrucomicrobiota bacterium]